MSDTNEFENTTRHYVTKGFVSLFVQNFLVFAGISVFNVIPDHLASLGASKTYIGFYMNLTALALVLLVIPLSRFSDRLGRKRLMIAGYATALASAGLSFFFAGDLVALALLRVPGTLLFCVVFTIQTTEAFRLIPRERRISGMAIYGTSGLVANPVASFIAERTLDGPGARWLFAVVFGFHALAMILALAYRFHEPGEDAERGPFLALLGRAELAPLFALTFMLGGAFSVFSTFLANLTRERLGEVTVSLFFASFSVVAVFIRLFLGPFIERRKAGNLTAVCYTSIAASFFMAFGLRSAGALVPIGILYGIGHSVLFPLLSTLFVNSGKDGEQLVLNNLYAATNTLGNIVIAVAFGAVADAFGVPSVFLCLTVLCAAMVPFAYFRLAR
jgi:predicted MFS family arabinose efflux permease